MTYLSDAINRVTALVKETFTDNSVSIDVVNYFPHIAEAFPYAMVQWTGAGKNNVYGQDFDDRVLSFDVWLIIGNIESGTDGERANELYEWSVWLEDKFAQSPSLTSTAYPTKPTDFNPLEMEWTANTGITIFNNSGVNSQVIGTRFTLTMQYLRINY